MWSSGCAQGSVPSAEQGFFLGQRQHLCFLRNRLSGVGVEGAEPRAILDLTKGRP